MLIVQRPHTNPWFNIAAEEYLLKNIQEDCFMLWQNEASIIVGKHQNTLAEINYQFVKQNNIPVIRRITGGGTVFHDPGNLNFTFISKGEKGKLVDFRKFTDPIIAILNQLGIPAEFEGKNDIKVNGLKISGNAEHVFKDRVLHHGTLLFSSDLKELSMALKVKSGKYTDKAVQSNRSIVTNISDHLTPKLSIETFKEKIIDYFSELHYPEFYHLTSEDEASINELVKHKYATWKWNFGYSPNYSYSNEVVTGDGNVLQLVVSIEKGNLINFILKENNSVHPLSLLILEKLINHPYEEVLLRDGLLSVEPDLISEGLNVDDVIKGLF